MYSDVFDDLVFHMMFLYFTMSDMTAMYSGVFGGLVVSMTSSESP